MQQSALKLSGLFACSAVGLVADQALKRWVVQHMALMGPSVPLVPNYLVMTYTRNFGSAWSMLWGQTWLLIAIAAGVALGIVVYAMRLRHRAWLQMTGLGFLLGGALGNLIDRARLGYVVDMFDLQNGGHNIFPIFNIADMCIDLGVALLLIYTYASSRHDADGQESPRPLAGNQNP